MTFNEGLAAWIAGDTDGALSLLLTAVKQGFHLPLDLHYLKDLYAAPGFEAPDESDQTTAEKIRP